MYTNFHGEHQHDSKTGSGKHVDQILREYFPDMSYKGVFFDVGAFEPIRISNSYHFEKNGWDCYCFEANTDNIPLLRSERANVFHYALGNEDKEDVTFQVVSSSGWTAGFSALTISEALKSRFGWNNFPVKELHVAQKTLNTILRTELPSVTSIDILSIDIEGGELNCLRGLDLTTFGPNVILVENATPEDRTLQNYLESFGYRLDRSSEYNQYYLSYTFTPP